LKYSFPETLELKSVIDLACVMAEGNEIEADDINFYHLEKDSNISYRA
jgi:DNA-binding NtrC family response regulator